MPSTDPLALVAGDPAGTHGYVDAVGIAARFYNPIDIKLNADGTKLVIADAGNRAVRVMDTTTFAVTTLTTFGPGFYPASLSVGASGDVYVAVCEPIPPIFVGGNTLIYRVTMAGVTTLIGSMVGEWRCDDVDQTETFLMGAWGESVFNISFIANKRIVDIATGINSVVAGEGAFPAWNGDPGALTHDGLVFYLTRDYIAPAETGMYLMSGATGAEIILFNPYTAPPDWPLDNGRSITRGPVAGPTMALTISISINAPDPSIKEWDYDPTTYELTVQRDRGAVPYRIEQMTGLAYANDAYFTSAIAWIGALPAGPGNGADREGTNWGHAIFMAGEIIPPPPPPPTPTAPIRLRPACDFGTAQPYLAVVFDRVGRKLCELGPRFNSTWTRDLDLTSTLTLEVTEDCCDCIPSSRAHEIALYRGGDLTQPVWQGPVENSTTTRKTLSITARDKSLYWYSRHSSADISHAGAAVDASVLFSELIAQAEAGSPSGLVFIPSALTGVMVERAIPAESDIGPHLDDLANEAIDWTVVGLLVYAGGVTTPAGGALPLVTSDHWDDPPSVVESGGMVTRVIVRAASDVLGIFPPGPAVPDPVYGIIEVEVPSPAVAKQPEADAFAQSYFERHRGPDLSIVTADSALSKRFPYSLADLIPGRLFPVLINSECREQLLILRLMQVTVNITSGAETSVKIDLQPIGTNQPTP